MSISDQWSIKEKEEEKRSGLERHRENRYFLNSTISSLSLSFGRNTHPRVASFFFIPVGLRAWLCGLLPMLRCGVVGSIRLSFSIWVQISAVVYNSGLGFRFLVFLFLSLGCAWFGLKERFTGTRGLVSVKERQNLNDDRWIAYSKASSAFFGRLGRRTKLDK